MADYGAGWPDADIARLSLNQGYDGPEQPPPAVQSAGVIPVDITQKFADAVQTLEPGELVKDGFFTLFESVAGLEIMDPKMDSGCVAPGDEFEELYDVSRPLLPEEVLGIIDQLICHEISWHLGYPLSQTLLSSVYVEALSMPEPGSIEEAQFVRARPNDKAEQPMLEVLRVYCLGMLKACSYVNDRIQSEHFYEEEDFVSNTYNRTLMRSVSASSIQKAITECIDLVESLRGSIADDILSGLSARLQLRRVFLKAAESPQHRRDMKRAQQPWIDAEPILSQIRDSHILAKPVEEAFSAKLQRKLASTMPPRPIVQLGFNEAFSYLNRLFEDGREVVTVLDYTNSQSLMTFVAMFQAKKPQPLVFVRSLLQTFLFDEMEVVGNMSIRQLLDDDMATITLPASPLLDRANDEIEAVHDARFTMSQQMELFRQRAAQPFLDVLRTLCQNRCRVRRTLCHLIRDWENLQMDAEEIDQIIQVKTKERPLVHRSSLGMAAGAMESYALSLSSWTYLYKLRLMENIVQLGFELEVYQPDELMGMYWYLNYLAKSRLQHTERIKTFVMHQVEQRRAEAAASSSSRRPDDAIEKQLQRSLAYTRLSLLDAAVTWELSDALACLYTVLCRLGLVKTPPRPYSNDELRYELRMKPFAAIGLPDLPSVEEFKAGVLQPDTSSEDLLAYGERALLGAKKGFEALTKLSAEESFSVGSHERWLAAMKNGLKSCIATGIAISTIQKALKAQDGAGGSVNLTAEVPTPDKSYHGWWIVPRVTPCSSSS